MEILPGEGVVSARVGERRDVIEARVGPPIHPRPSSRAVYDTSPMLVVDYTADDLAEIVQLSPGPAGDHVYFDGVQLTWRFMDEVVADLAARGHQAERDDIGFIFRAGFGVFSMGSLCAQDFDPDAAEDDPRRIVEGVSIASYDYLLGPTEEEIAAYIRAQETS